MRRFVYTSFWLTVFGTLAIFFLSTYEKTERLELRVTRNIRTNHIDRIWFSPGGELVGVGRNETQLIVRVWSGAAGALVRERVVSLPGNSQEKPVFAVSGDASQAAWLDPAWVRLVSLIAPERESTAILRTVFLRELVEWAAENGLAPAGVTGPALTQLAEGRSGAAADQMAAALETREQALHAYLRQRFRVVSELSPAHRLIKEIDFQALVTTSLDNLLDRTFPYSGGHVYTAGKCEDLVKMAARRDFFLLKPYGDLDEPDTIRIGPKQCAEVIASNAAVSNFMERLIETRVFLFIGASLEGIERDLAHLNLPAPTNRKHYALVPITGEGWKVAAERLRGRYAIEPLTYAPSTAQHPEVVEFLTKLNDLVRQKTTTQSFEAAE
jgi:hypothetical protein